LAACVVSSSSQARRRSSVAAEAELELEGPAAGERTTVVVFFTDGSRELGVYRKLVDGGEDYVSDYQPETIPHSLRPTTTTLRLELGPPARALLSWAAGPTITLPLDGKLPATIAKLSFGIGAKRVAPGGGDLDVRFDDVSCDVE
jgi:hypothetical protein